MKNQSARCVWSIGALLGEGPLWWEERDTLLFVDIKRPAILGWHPDRGGEVYSMPDDIGCIVHRRSGGLVVALRKGIAFVSLDPLNIKLVRSLETDVPGNRFNDGKCDPGGRFWVASMDDAVRRPTGAMWRINTDISASRIFGGHIVGNGLGWSPDGETMYFTDSEDKVIYAFTFDNGTGTPGERRVFAVVPPDSGLPDGLTVDREGGVWSAHWDGARITRYLPDGTVDRVISMPIPRPTSLAFGGPGLSKLYVTSASTGLSKDALRKAPLSGGLFELDAGVCGKPEPRFAG